MVVWSGERVSARSKQPRLCRELQSLVCNLNFGEEVVEGSRRRGKKTQSAQ